MPEACPKIGVGVVIFKDNKTLLTERKNNHGAGSYGSIGGHLEYGESIYEALPREAKEELGLELENIRFLCCSNLIKYGKHYVDISFVADIKSGEPAIQEPDKIASVDWYDLDNLPEPLFEPVRIAIETYKGGEVFVEIK